MVKSSRVASFEEHSQGTGVGAAFLAPHLPWHLPPLIPSNTTDVQWGRRWGDVFFSTICTFGQWFILCGFCHSELRKCKYSIFYLLLCSYMRVKILGKKKLRMVGFLSFSWFYTRVVKFIRGIVMGYFFKLIMHFNTSYIKYLMNIVVGAKGSD